MKLLVVGEELAERIEPELEKDYLSGFLGEIGGLKVCHAGQLYLDNVIMSNEAYVLDLPEPEEVEEE